jgi:osmoprotectant transport system ATP-binding protein
LHLGHGTTAPQEGTVVIELLALSKAYLDITVVDRVTLTVPDGEIATIVGTSGSGKTTLLRMINRLIEPTSGSVRIDGEDTRKLAPHELRRRIGYVIQGHGLFPHRTVAQNVGTVPQLLGWERSRIAQRVDQLLELFQLPPAEYRNRLPSELSGGQQQRIGVARALAAEPRLLLMDEPFGALDPIIRRKAQDDLLGIQRRFETTIVLVTHDMDEAIHLGDRIAVMDGGKLLQYASPEEVITRPATAFVGELLGTGERTFRLLSLQRVADVVEPGEAPGPPIAGGLTLRDALDEALWTGRSAVPVVDAEGTPLGRVTLDTLARHGARPK